MKISILIKILEQAKEVEGDVAVKIWNNNGMLADVEEIASGPVDPEKDPCVVINW